MAIAREAEPVGSLKEVREAGPGRGGPLGIYRTMLMTRGIEERGHILYKQGKIPGSFYTGRGNEAASVGVATARGPEDVGTPRHRDMGVHIVRGVEPWRMFAQYMGRVDGPTKGKDGNVHMADARLGLIAMVSHLPAMLPVAVGCALAFRIREEMFEEWAKRDPIERFRTWLRENADFSDEEEEEIRGEVKKILNDAIKRAEESPLPDASSLLEGVFATPEDLDTPHHK